MPKLQKSLPLQRYLSKLINNLGGSIISAAMVFVVPRALGPKHFGDFNFLRDSFQEITGILDLNIGGAHFNYSSKYIDTKDATTLYYYFCLILGIVLFLGITIINQVNLLEYFWPDQQVENIYLGAVLAYLMYLSIGLTALSDSKEATVGIEIRRLIIAIIGFPVLLILFFNGALTLSTFFGQQILVSLLLIVIFVLYLKSQNVFGFKFERIKWRDTKEIYKYFISYSHPLLTFSILGFLFGYFDRWFLQIISGSVSQGYYSLAFRLSSICILFTGAMVPVFRQMVSKAHGESNKAYIQTLFQKSRIFYFFSAFISIFFLFHSKEIIYFVGGDEYSAAKTPLMIMMLYPIHQTYGQFCGSMLMSLERTDLFRNIGICSNTLGPVLSYFLIAPSSFIIPGMDLGAIGLSLKMTITQLVFVNFALFFVCKIINEHFNRYLIHQFLVLIPLLIIGYIAHGFVSFFFKEINGVFGNISFLLISGSLYLTVIAAFCWISPGLLGLKRHELNAYIETLTTFVRSKQ